MEDQPKSFQLSPNPDSHHSHRVLFYALGAIFFLVIIAGSIGFILGMNNNQSLIPQQNQRFSSTPSPSSVNPSSSSIQVVNPTGISNISLKNYVDPIFDITFQYPSDWAVTSGVAQNGAFIFACTDNQLLPFLKDASKCNGAMQSPMITIAPLNSKHSSGQVDGIALIGPTAGLGGGCTDCQFTNTSLQINGIPYQYVLNIHPNGSKDANFLLKQTGRKSVWSQIAVEIASSSDTIYNAELNILQSIKPNENN